MRAQSAGSLMILDAQDALAGARTLEDTYPREVLVGMTDDELRRAEHVLGGAAHRLERLEHRIAIVRRNNLAKETIEP